MAYITFHVPIGYRLYDREKNKVIPLHEEEYLALERLKNGQEAEEDTKVLQMLQSKGYCCESVLDTIEHPATQNLESRLESKINQLILQVTQNCNLRCSYCAYSGSYYNRQHNGKRMTLDTAIRAVDFFFSHSTGVEEAAIGFYGGEPFLEFDLIKQVVDYIETEYAGRNVVYTLTSNLTLLTDEIIDFLVEKDVQLMISIDGPQKVQDKYRIFSTGAGSYQTVLANAEKLYQRSPAYFKKCATNTVASPGENYGDILSFLDHNFLFGPLVSKLAQVNDSGLKEEIHYGDEYYQMLRREKFKILLYMLGQITHDKISKTLSGIQAGIIQTHQQLKSGGTQNSKSAHPGGPCIPGERRLFVDVDGNFYPCERISEYEQFQVGSLDRGFDLERVKQMINVGQYTEKECVSCWAFLFCGTCIASMIDKTEPSRAMRLKGCQSMRENAVHSLADMETVKYYGYNFAADEGENDG